MPAPLLTAPLAITDGGLETTLIFQDGIDLPDFAAFPLLDSPDGCQALAAYYQPYLDLARRLGVPIVLDTPTWRASPDWGDRLGYDPARLADVNRRSVDFVRSLAEGGGSEPVEHIVNGAVGPRGDGYVVGDTMTPDQAEDYHSLQARAFAEAGAQLMTGVTMTYVDEALGVVRAAEAAGLPVAVSFTVETDGTLPSGQPLGEAIERVDEVTDGAPAHFMVNCAHPTHFVERIDAGAGWAGRVKGIRANASAASHEELDAATELDRGDVAELTDWYRRLHSLLPDVRVVGGCCGTDHEHVAAIAEALVDAGAADG